MLKWWQDPRLDDEGTYDYLVEELPIDKSEWSRYPTKCGDCGNTRSLHVTHYHYFYCYDGWDSIDYSVCWKCYVKSVIRNKVSKLKKMLRYKSDKVSKRKAYKMFLCYCDKHNIAHQYRQQVWDCMHDYFESKANYQIMKGGKSQ
jgi:hypothetical protein